MDMRIQIEDAQPKDIKEYGMELIKSPLAYSAPIKGSNIVTVDFPEEDGVEVYIPDNPKMESIDYEITLAFVKKDGESISQKINSFVSSLKGKKVTVYNDYKGVSFEGYLKKYTDGEMYKGSTVATFKITFLVPKPNLINYQ